MQNQWAIYLHDTNARSRFNDQARALSLLIRAGVREAIAMVDLENEWRRRQRPNRPS